MNINDSINRIRSNPEKNLSETINNNNNITDLVDAYRFKHKEGGFTWKRGTCYSRLDYIFVSASLLQVINKVVHKWSFESSDHAAIMITFKQSEVQTKGPGIIKINTTILDNPEIVKQIVDEITILMNQTDDSWTPHSKLEFFKVAIRSVFSTKVSEIRRDFKTNIDELEEESDQMEDLKLNVIKQCDTNPNLLGKIDIVDKAISDLKIKLIQLRTKLSNTLAFKSKIKWFEYGEKSNKFFLNLIKSRQNKKLISHIRNGNQHYEGKGVMNGIKDFYADLYSAKPRTILNNDKDNYYDNCPKLTKIQAELMDRELTIEDLTKSLNSCKDSAPGPDGIPYVVYKK
jgi:hypothetical protein